MERLEYDLLFRWFVGIGVDDAAWDHSVFSKNRDRRLEGDIAAKFLAAVLAQPRVKGLLSGDHFSVDGNSLLEEFVAGAGIDSLGQRTRDRLGFRDAQTLPEMAGIFEPVMHIILGNHARFR